MAEGLNVSCLVIDGVGGVGALCGMAEALRERGVAAADYVRDRRQGLHADLQRAYQRIRQLDGVNAIVASGAGCDCALAVAAQLPVDRMVLLCPEDDCEAPGEFRRVRAYGRRNAALCASDVLLIGWSGRDDAPLRRLCRSLCACRTAAALAAEDLWTNRKEVLKLGILRFLCEGVPPKSLAENPEMCIIYG